jgi:nitrogen-specific signal transduction histidine kinase
MDRSLLIGLAHRTKSILDSIEGLAYLSREKFIDKEFGESFCSKITSDIEHIDLLMNGFLNYIKSTTPIIKKDTVNTLIDEVLKKHQTRLEERKIRILKRFEKELPETIVPDEQMTFILDSVLQYAMASILSGGIIEFSTKSFAPLKAIGEERVKNIEIMATFAGFQRPREQLAKESGLRPPQKEEGLDLLLQLVYAVVQENQGTMEHESGERKEKSSIVLKFPAERRKAAKYQPVDE